MTDRVRRRWAHLRAWTAMLLGATLAVAASAAPGASASAENGSGFALVGRVPLAGCSSQAQYPSTIEPQLHLYFMVFVVGSTAKPCPGITKPGMWLQATSTSTLQSLPPIFLSVPDFPVNGYFDAVVALRTDPVRHRLLVLYQGSSSPAECPSWQVRVAIFDLGMLASHPAALSPASVINVPQTASPSDPGQPVSPNDPTEAINGTWIGVGCHQLGSVFPFDLSYDPGTDSTDVLENDGTYGGPPPPSIHGQGSPPYVFDFDTSTGHMRWVVQLGQCATQMYYSSAQKLMHIVSAGQEEVAGGCMYSRGPSTGSNGGNGGAGSGNGIMTTWVIPVDGRTHAFPSGGQVSYYFGRPAALSGAADPGSQRIIYTALSPSSGTSATRAGPAGVIFDAAHRVYVGAPTLGGPNSGEGYDHLAVGTNGPRWYAASQEGIYIGSLVSTPPGQGVRLAGYSSPTWAITPDAANGRVFIQPYNSASGLGVPANYALVYQDDTAVGGASATPDPDRYTQQIPERPGVTVAAYSGHADATGARVRLVGGVSGALDGATLNGYTTLKQSVALPPSYHEDYATHEVDMGRINSTDLSDFQAQADVEAATIDDTTGSTLSKPTVTNPATGGNTTANGLQWPFHERACSDPGSTVQQSENYGSSGSQATCKFGVAATASSSAEGLSMAMALLTQSSSDAQAVPSNLKVAQATSRTGVYLNPTTGLGLDQLPAADGVPPNAGMVSRSWATVEGVDFGPVTFQAVTAESVCWAHGHKGTARCTFTRSLSGVTAAGRNLGSCAQLPGTDTCSALLAQLNALDPGFLVFSLPVPGGGPGNADGSPGGYQALSQRPMFEHLQDSVLNQDDSTETPGLHVLYVEDSNSSPSRLDLQLANVESEAHYGIQTADTGSDFQLCATDCGPALAIPQAPVGPAPAMGDVSTTLIIPPSPGVIATLGRALERIWDGIKWLVRTPKDALLSALLLSMLAGPLLLTQRRRRLELLNA